MFHYRLAASSPLGQDARGRIADRETGPSHHGHSLPRQIPRSSAPASTASARPGTWRENLRKSGRGSGKDILVIDKTGIAAGASGIACGVIRNNYYQPAMRRLMAHSVSVWESDPKAFSYHPVGYMQISPEVMHEQVGTIAKQQKEIGYESVFIEGEKDSMTYMKGLFDDWQAKGITSVLHEKKGGYANNTASIYGLAKKAENEGVRLLTGRQGHRLQEGQCSGAVKTVVTDKGNIDCDYVIVGVGPWVKQIWDMLELPAAITDQGPRRQAARQRADVDLLVAAGGHARRRSEAAAHQ